MKTQFSVYAFFVILTFFPAALSAQSIPIEREYGLSVGGFTNFPANKHFLDDNIHALYLAPYMRVGRHEFSAGLLVPLAAKSLYFPEDKISPRPGFIAGYRFFVFDPAGRENMFIHYAFEYMWFSGDQTVTTSVKSAGIPVTEKNMYINNVIGLGYNLFFDMNARFGFYYLVDYVISQLGYNLAYDGNKSKDWTSRYIWNNLSNHIGFTIRLGKLPSKKD